MTKIYCSNCGQLIDGLSNFCRFCGATQHGTEASAYRAQAPAVPIGDPLPVATATGEDIEYIPRRTLGSGALVAFFLSFLTKNSPILLLGVVGIALRPELFLPLLFGYIVLIFLVTVLVYNNFFFRIDDDGLTVESGVIHKYQVTVPFEQIQNVNIERTLIDRFLGVSRLSIETAGAAPGTSGQVANGGRTRAEAYLPGIDLALAKKIHDLLIDASEVARG